MIGEIRVNLSVCGNYDVTNVTNIVTYKVVTNNWKVAQACLAVAFLFNLSLNCLLHSPQARHHQATVPKKQKAPQPDLPRHWLPDGGVRENFSQSSVSARRQARP